MTKENFINKWAYVYNVNDTTNPYFVSDLEAVIANEIAMAQIEKTKETRKIEISDYTLVEICRAFRALRKDKNSYIHHVFSDDYVFHAMNEIEKAYENYFGKKPEQITTDQVTDQEQPVMTEKEKIDHILTNKLTWKPMVNKRFYANWFSAESEEGYRQVHFVDYNNPHSGYYSTRIFTIDLAEWQPVETEKPSSQAKLDNSFDKDRFEAMFRAVVASGRNGGYDADVEETEKALTKLDAYYASKEGGENGI